MKYLALVILLLSSLVFIVFWGCSREEIFSSSDSEKTENPPRFAVENCQSMECDDEECDAEFIEEFLNQPGDCGCTLTINDDGTFQLPGVYKIHGCGNRNIAMIYGQANRPTLNFTHMLTGGYDHAVLFYAENTGRPSKLDVLHDLIIKTRSRMGYYTNYTYYVPGDSSAYATRPGIQFEHCGVDMKNVLLDASVGDPTTTHFLSPLLVKIDNIVLTEHHQLVCGVDYWCGDPEGCGPFGGMGANPPTDGSYIKNSDLYGLVLFDIDNVYDDNTFTFSDNDSISTLVLDVIDNAYLVKAELIGNSFADKEGAKVIIIGDYYVDAEENVTHNGPCECDALEDFDVTHANSSSQLDLISWVYDGHTYTTDEIEITGIDWLFNPIACTVTVTWTTNNPSASKVYYGASRGSLNYSEDDEEETISHVIVCDIMPLTPPVYFKVESWNACDTATSECQAGPTRGQCVSP